MEGKEKREKAGVSSPLVLREHCRAVWTVSPSRSLSSAFRLFSCVTQFVFPNVERSIRIQTRAPPSPPLSSLPPLVTEGTKT